jgi:hypothetical protein
VPTTSARLVQRFHEATHITLLHLFCRSMSGRRVRG